MSVPVALSDLAAAVRDRGPDAYVLTVTVGATPHVVRAEVLETAGGLSALVGERTADNARRRPHVTVLYPAPTSTDYSLIVDATAIVVGSPEGARLLLTPTRAVLHRPAPAPDPSTSPCGSDCVPLSLASAAPHHE